MRFPSRLLLVGLLIAAPLAASPVKHFRTQSRDAFLAGTLDGLSVDSAGRLSLAHRAERLASIEEPFLLSAARRGDGWVVGTGNAGRVIEVAADGSVQTLFETAEPEVFAVWAAADGTVYAGTSPEGKVYRWRKGESEVFFDPPETYVWAIAPATGGSLWVATGLSGKLYRVDPSGEGEVVYESADDHLRSLAPLPSGGALIGTASDGQVLRIGADGSVRMLFDAEQPEIVAVLQAPDDAVYLAAVDSEASRVERRGGQQSEGNEGDEGGSASAKTEGEGAASSSSGRKVRSEIYRVTPDGLVESLWAFETETVYSLAWDQQRLWVGTGQEGKLYSFDGTTLVLEKDLDERQVVALLPDGRRRGTGPSVATTNGAAVYRMAQGLERQGNYTSEALDAGQIARFGTLFWRGELPSESQVRFAFRSGNSGLPDDTWSPWTDLRSGRQVPLDGVPSGRFLQWRAELESSGDAAARLIGVEISYRQQNLRPKITSLTVLEPGEVLVPPNFNPSNQVYEPAHPNKDGIFTSLTPANPNEAGRQKTLWKRGYRSLRWTAEDPNEDGLEYAISVRKEGAESGWLPVVSDAKRTYYSFDSTVLPDGVYRFRLVASDKASEGNGDGLEAEQLSEPVVVDHRPPSLVEVERRGRTLRLTVADEANPLREAVVSEDAGAWRTANPQDHLLDGREEILEIEPGEGTRLLLLRLTDAAYNSVTVDLSEHLR